jgi:hypothetical protein|tara:strand:- start:91 stop:369 length:279 start_codon:yes stop_codon:yes gene_type:complete
MVGSDMTFEEFVATRIYCDLLKRDIGDIIDVADGQDSVMGMLYGDNYYILDNDTTGNEWYLILENDYYLSNDLSSLEKLLYEWYANEVGCCA